MSEADSELVDIDFGEFDPENLDEGSGKYLGLDDVGKYHFLVQKVDTRNGKTKTFKNDDGTEETVPESMAVTLSVVAPATHVGRQTTVYFNKTGKGAKKTLIFAKAVGIVTQEALKKAAETAKAGGSPKLSIAYGLAEGLPLLAELEKNDYNPQKPRAQVGFQMFHIFDRKDHPEYPIDEMFTDGHGRDDNPDGDPFSGAA